MNAGEQIEALKARHAQLETVLEEEARRPHPDPLTIAQIKKEKLRLKDELMRLDAV